MYLYYKCNTPKLILCTKSDLAHFTQVPQANCTLKLSINCRILVGINVACTNHLFLIRFILNLYRSFFIFHFPHHIYQKQKVYFFIKQFLTLCFIHSILFLYSCMEQTIKTYFICII